MHLSETIPATLEAISEFIQSLEQRLESTPLAVRIGITLPLQELCVNIVRHAYEGREGQILIEMNQTGQDMAITVTDSAPKAFTPSTAIVPPDLNELPEGGMGLFIIYQSFDRVIYERLTLGNRWHLTKTLS